MGWERSRLIHRRRRRLERPISARCFRGPERTPRAPSGRRPGRGPRAETEAITGRATEPSISERFGWRLEALNASRLLERGAGPPEAEPTVSSLQGGETATGPSATLGARPKPGQAFDDAVRNLQSAFHHAIEVELVAKTGTSLNSSMNKLMSGS